MIYFIKELLYIYVYDPFISLVQIFQKLTYKSTKKEVIG